MSDEEPDDDNLPAPKPMNNWGDDDDEPPAAGAVTVEFIDGSMRPSTAPTAEPNHRANPTKVVF